MGTLTPTGYSILPAQKKVTLSSNYLSFTDGDNDFAQQYLPEIYEAEVERYGNRTLSGFLRMVGAEMPMTSDQVVWSEQNRLHIAYENCTVTAGDNTILIDATNVDAANPHVIRENQTIVISRGTVTSKAIVIGAPTATTVEAFPYGGTDWPANLPGTDAKVFVYGSEFKKGVEGMSGAVDPSFTQFDNKPVIIKDKYEVSGSDAAQIGWVEVATESGDSGYLWYLKAEGETRLRFEDYLEMTMVEAEKDAVTATPGFNAGSRGYGGSEGLFAAIEDRGNIMTGFSAPAAGSGALTDFDTILKRLDKEGAIEENMLFLNRALALDIDDMLGAVNAGFAGTAPNLGASFGLFDNEAEMALNLGFSGFRRGSYDFYKTDWKYLNDASTRGLAEDIDGVLIPAGTSTVYDQMLGQNIRRPFLHVRYRASQADDRRMKSWITGSVGGSYTSDLDAMEVHFLSERCLCVQGANNFVLFKS